MTTVEVYEWDYPGGSLPELIECVFRVLFSDGSNNVLDLNSGELQGIFAVLSLEIIIEYVDKDRVHF